MKKNYKIYEFILPLLLLSGFILIAYFTRKTTFTIILSLTLAYILNPLVRFFEIRGIRRIYAVSFIYLSIGVIIYITGFIIINAITFDIDSLVKNWTIHYQKYELLLTRFMKKIMEYLPFLTDLITNSKPKILNVISEIPQYIITAIPSLLTLILIPVISFFILISGDEILNTILNHIPSKYVELILHIVSKIDHTLGKYLRGILIEAIVLFLISFIGLYILNIKYYSIIAILLGFSPVIPYIGAIIGAIISAVIAYVQYNNIYIVIKVLIFFATVRFFDDWFLQPYVMQKNVNLNPALVILGLMAGAEIAGFWGVVFAIPVICIIKEIISITVEIHETQFMWKPKPEPSRSAIPYT